MTALIGFWSHAVAALLFGALTVWQSRYWNADSRNRPLALAFAITCVWAVFSAIDGPRDMLSGFAESARNLAFLAFMYGIVRSAAPDQRQRAVRIVYAIVGAVVGLQIALVALQAEFGALPLVSAALFSTGAIIGVTVSAGALVLVHNLYGQAAPEARWGIRLPMVALAGMWTYDLHLYTVAYLTGAGADGLFAMRGAIAAMLVPIFALASRRNASWKMRLSRAATFQSLSALAILGYLIVMMSTTRMIEVAGAEWMRIAQLGLVFAISVAAAILLPSGKARAWLRVIVAKHFFEHRYDYREEWLRFTHTVSQPGEDDAALEDRVVKALADIADAPGGLLLAADDHYGLSAAARWNWPGQIGQGAPEDAAFARLLEAKALIVDFDSVEDGMIADGKERVPVPAWLADLGAAWAGIPLIHNGRLVGIVILQHPLVRRPLDWEDYDLFRTAGSQAASYLAEARSHEALANLHRFDEFNRRFAFIMHDIKNLVSQLSLVARNAERHADNPEFRADMIATLQSSVKKMNDLLDRLSRGRSPEQERPRRTPVGAVAGSVAEIKRRLHPVELFGDTNLAALADPSGLEEALGHLVQNAIDASPADAPVRICLARRGSEIRIDVIDSGTGMSIDFVRNRLFQPFASTKQGGFGIGAFEARALVTAMGGRIEVDSREGEGSRFTIILPAAEAQAELKNERMRA